MQSSNATVFADIIPLVQREAERILFNQLQNSPYDTLKTKDQIIKISQTLIDKMTTANKNFKYIINVVMLPIRGGLDLGGLSYWNTEMDGSVAVKFQNKHLRCIVTVYGISA